MKSIFSLLLFCLVTSHSLCAQSLDTVFDQFEQVYRTELGSTRGCQQPSEIEFAVCSVALRNDGNAPYILHHGIPTDKVIVLFHGLSDSPFYLRSIAQSFFQQGYNVVVGLLAGHGKKNADDDMEDPELANRWRKNVSDVVTLASNLGDKTYLGGFSTGGALAAEYVVIHPDELNGLLLFSGALQLDDSVESIANVWGIRWLAKQLDGEYATEGPNQYKYPSVSKFAAFQLVDVIFSLREHLEQIELKIPIFVAHSQADTTTMIQGVEDFMSHNKGVNQFFVIPQSENVCHADLVISQQQLQDMHFATGNAADKEGCSIPRANPMHAEMLAEANQFLRDN